MITKKDIIVGIIILSLVVSLMLYFDSKGNKKDYYIITIDNHEYVKTINGICHKENCKYCMK